MSEEKEHKKIRKPKKRNPFLRFLFTLFFLFLIIEVVFLFFATPILRQTLNSTIENKSKGVYSLDFDSLSIDIGGRSFIFFGLELKPNLAIYQKLKKEKKVKRGLYSFRFKKLKLKNLKVLKLVNERKLDFKEFLIDSPDIVLKDLPINKTKQSKKYKAVEKDLYPALLDALYYIKVKNVKILHGKFNFWVDDKAQNSMSSAQNISFELHRFYLDANVYLNNKTKLFFADRTIVHLKGYTLNLKDKIHTLDASDITIDTKKKELTADNVRFWPNQISLKKQDTIKSSIMDVQLPSMVIRGFDLTKMMYKKDILIKELQIINPNLNIYIYKKDKKKDFNIDYSLNFYPLIKGFLKTVNIDEFVLEKANIHFFDKKNKSKKFAINNVNIRLHRFTLNKNSYLDKSRVFGAQNLNLFSGKMEVNLKDEVHKLKINSFKFSTITQKLKLRGLQLEAIGIKDTLHKKNKIEIKIPILNITGFDLKKLIHYNYLPLRKLEIINPDLSVQTFEKWRKKTGTENQKFKKFIFTYFKQLMIYRFEINNMAIKYSQNINNDSLNVLSYLNFKVSNLRLTPHLIKQPNKFFYSDSFKISLHHFKMEKAGTISFDTLYTASTDSIFQVVNFKFIPSDKQKRQLKMDIPRMSIFNVDFQKILFNRKLMLDSILVLKPNIQFTVHEKDSLFGLAQTKPKIFKKWKNISDSVVSDTQKVKLKELAIFKGLSYLIDTISVRSGYVQQGNLQLKNIKANGKVKLSFKNKLSAQLHHFYLNLNMNIDSIKKSKKLFFTDTLIVSFHDYELKFPDGIHSMKVKQLTANSATQVIKLDHIHIEPNLSNNKTKPRIWISWQIPHAELLNINYKKLLVNKELDAEALIIDTSRLKIYSKRDSLSRFKAKRFKMDKIKLPKNIKLIHLNSIRLEPTSIINYSQDSTFTYLSTKVDLSLYDFKIDSTQEKTKLFPAADLQLNLSNLKMPFADSTQRISIASALYSSGSKYFSAQKLHVYYVINSTPKNFLFKTKRSSLLDFYIDDFYADSMDLNSLLRRQLKINLAQAHEVRIKTSSLVGDTTGNYNRNNWYQKVYPYFDSLSIDKFVFREAFLDSKKYFSYDSLKKLKLELSGTLFDFKVNRKNAIKIPARLYHEKAEVTLKNFTLNSKDGQYRLQIPSLKANTIEKKVWVSHFSYKPIAPIDTFVKENKTTYIGIDSLNLIAQNANFDDYFLRKAITTENVNISNFSFIAASNNNYPPDSLTKGKMLMELIEKFPFKTKIDTLGIKNGHAIYSLKSLGAKYPGKILIKDIRGNALRITNDNLQYKKWKNSFFDLNMTIYQKSNFNLQLKLYPQTNNKYKLTGSLSDFDFRLMNEFLLPTYATKVKSGNTKNTRFFMEGNNDIQEGKMRFEYQNFKVNMLKAKKDTLLKKRGFASYLANTVLRKNNPRKVGLILKEGVIYSKRDSIDGFISYWIDGILEGVKSTVGLRSKEVKEYQRLQLIIEEAKRKVSKYEEKANTKNRSPKRKSRKVLRWSKRMKEEEQKFNEFKQKQN